MNKKFLVLLILCCLCVIKCDYISNFVPNYVYPIPPNPGQFDEPSTPSGLYGPPQLRPNATIPPFQDEIPQINPTYLPPPGVGLQPPHFDPLPTDDTVVIPSNDYIGYGTSNQNIPVQVRVFNMSCLDTNSRRFFRSTIRTSQIRDITPIVENNNSGGECVLGSGDLFRLALEGNKMSQCGVRYCPSNDRINMCVTVRLPTVRGLRLPEDTLVTLQCRPQESVVSHVKNVRFNAQNIQSRSAATIAAGGLQRNFDTQVDLLRRGPGGEGFTQIVTPGTSVQLGEELLIRAAVREGDGWKYSRMGAVTMHRVTPHLSALTTPTTTNHRPGTYQNSVTLVDSSGCRASGMKSVCPEQPRQVSQLVTTLPFRAFMFQGANSGDEMVLSVRILGCLQYEDCYQTRSCDEKGQLKRTRTRREITNNTKTIDNVTDWQSYLEFRVVIPGLLGVKETETVIQDTTTVIKLFVLFGIVTGAVFLLLCIILILKNK